MRTHAGRRVVTLSAALLVVAAGLTAGLQATAAAAATPTCFGKPATIVGSSRGTTIHGTTGDDVIVAGGGSDTVYGGTGDDLICGGSGADRLHGGAGNDWLAGESGTPVRTKQGTRISNDILYGDTGDDFFSPGFDNRYPSETPDRISYSDFGYPVTVSTVTHSAQSSHGTDTWIGDRAAIVGSPFDDTFTGGPLRDIFQGGPGSDILHGNGGDDTMRDDYESAPHHTADTLEGGAGDDQLFTFGGNDVLDGGDGNDLLSDYGHDAGTMDGGPGDDVINDAITRSPDQAVDGGSGVDKVTLYVDKSKGGWPRLSVDLSAGVGTFVTSSPVSFRVANTNLLYVLGLPLTFNGDGSDNTVWTDGTGPLRAAGNAGNDTFTGSNGDDTYDGGLGLDKANTMGGDDRCTSVEVVKGGRCPAP